MGEPAPRQPFRHGEINWVGEIYEDPAVDDTEAVLHAEGGEGDINIMWPDNGTGRGPFVERLAPDRLVARRVAARRVGIVHNPNPEDQQAYQQAFRRRFPPEMPGEPPRELLPLPEMPGEEADAPPEGTTGENPISADARLGGAWAERNHTIPIDADFTVHDRNGEHYRPHITHAVIRMTGNGTTVRDVRAVDRFGIWEIRYSEEVNAVRAEGNVTIRRSPHRELTQDVRIYNTATNGGTITIGADAWGTNAAANFMWDIPVAGIINPARIDLERGLFRPGAEDLLLGNDEEAQARAAVRQLESEERQKFRKAAESKAEKLLKALLSPDQLRDYESDRCFYMEVNGELFRVDYGTSGNVKRLDPVSREIIESFCIHPGSYHYELPVQDVMVAQKLLLEADPDQFKRTANRWGRNNQLIYNPGDFHYMRMNAGDVNQFVIGDDAVINADEEIVFANANGLAIPNLPDLPQLQIPGLHLDAQQAQQRQARQLEEMPEAAPLTAEEARRLEFEHADTAR